jgi:hypothetical protein
MNRLSSDTAAYRFQCWTSFVLSLGATSIGIWFLPVDAWTRAFLGLGLWFTVSASMNLSKAVRDAHEAGKLTAVVEEAKTERILRDLSRADAA